MWGTKPKRKWIPSREAGSSCKFICSLLLLLFFSKMLGCHAEQRSFAFDTAAAAVGAAAALGQKVADEVGKRPPNNGVSDLEYMLLLMLLEMEVVVVLVRALKSPDLKIEERRGPMDRSSTSSLLLPVSFLRSFHRHHYCCSYCWGLNWDSKDSS